MPTSSDAITAIITSASVESIDAPPTACNWYKVLPTIAFHLGFPTEQLSRTIGSACRIKLEREPPRRITTHYTRQAERTNLCAREPLPFSVLQKSDIQPFDDSSTEQWPQRAEQAKTTVLRKRAAQTSWRGGRSRMQQSHHTESSCKCCTSNPTYSWHPIPSFTRGYPAPSQDRSQMIFAQPTKVIVRSAKRLHT